MLSKSGQSRNSQGLILGCNIESGGNWHIVRDFHSLPSDIAIDLINFRIRDRQLIKGSLYPCHFLHLKVSILMEICPPMSPLEYLSEVAPLPKASCFSFRNAGSVFVEGSKLFWVGIQSAVLP